MKELLNFSGAFYRHKRAWFNPMRYIKGVYRDTPNNYLTGLVRKQIIDYGYAAPKKKTKSS